MQPSKIKNRFSAPTGWSAEILRSNPVFSDLRSCFPVASYEQWPQIADLNQWANGRTEYRFIDSEQCAASGLYYEDYIYSTGKIPTREENWHDLFGALIWCLFPQSKQKLNELHQIEIQQHGLQQRSRLRNKLTLLDECGVIIAYAEPARELVQQLQTHQWQSVFWQHRALWWHSIRPVIFGHAIYEMATRPFIGLTAKCWFIAVPDAFFQFSSQEATDFLDTALSKQLDNKALLIDNRQLTPLPLLGIPGWFDANQQQDFYADTSYFRPLKNHNNGIIA